MKKTLFTAFAVLAAGIWAQQPSEADLRKFGSDNGRVAAADYSEGVKTRRSELMKRIGEVNRALDGMNTALKNGYYAQDKIDAAKELLKAVSAPLAGKGELLTKKDVPHAGRSLAGVPKDKWDSLSGKTIDENLPLVAVEQTKMDSVNTMISVLRSMDAHSRPKLAAMMQTIVADNIIGTAERWNGAATRIKSWKHTERFAAFNRSCNSAMHTLDMMALKKYTGITLDDFFLSTSPRLDDFAADDFRLKPSFDADLVVLDKYLRVMNKDALDIFKASVERLKAASYDALMELGGDFDRYESTESDIHPDDRAIFKMYFERWTEFHTLAENQLVKLPQRLVAEAEDASTEVGSLRKMGSGASWAAVFRENASAPSNGCPGYRARAAYALKRIKERYQRLSN